MSQENCYHDFDSLLLIDWIKAGKGDLTRLRISGGNDELDIEAWENINDEHGESFGTDSKHMNYLRLVKKLTILKLDLVITEDQFILNNIEIIEEQIQVLLKTMTDGSASMSDTLFALSEKGGYMINEMNITAKKFFEMVKYYGKKD
jgi:hypothetical protein